MLTKAEIKLINQLKLKKTREKHQLFIVEGDKSIQEFLDGPFQLVSLYGLENTFFSKGLKKITPQELKKISHLTTPQNSLAVFKLPHWGIPKKSGFLLGLDGIQDPGNLGTLIRLADWFGITHIICSKNTVDVFNPKVIQASMGSLNRIQIHYLDLERFLNDFPAPIFGAFMDGENVYQKNLSPEGILILGNEGNGISTEIKNLCTQKISIPQVEKTGKTESLNVAVAGSILISQFYAKSLRN